MFKRLTLLAFCLTPLFTLAAGKIYTWTDADGNVVYGDRPPMGTTAKEVAVQGKKKAPINIDEQQLSGQWFGTSNEGSQAKITLNDNGTIRFLQTKSDQTTLNYQGIWTLENQTLTVITEFTQTAEPNKQFVRSVEPLQITYTIISFADEQMDMAIEGERYTMSRTGAAQP
ncbi:MAG: DUF4124 domain-containing protein [Reinekea sp.]